jgi:medium-chain acyl-[acyl-carrier-protein] hydrolase
VTQHTSPNGVWFLRLRRQSVPRMRLFCFPYAGGGAGIYRSWPAGLPEEVEVLSVRLPGREARLAEAPFTNVGDLAPAAADANRPFLDLPFAFFGHSMGALAAFEVARELRRRGGPTPACLVVSGARAPHRPYPDPPVRELPDAEFLTEVRSRYDAIPAAVLANPELVELLLPSLRADFTVVETYDYREEAPLTCPIWCYGGLSDERVSREDLEAWSSHTSSAYALQMFPGNHFFLHSAETAVFQAITQALA